MSTPPPPQMNFTPKNELYIELNILLCVHRLVHIIVYRIVHLLFVHRFVHRIGYKIVHIFICT